MYNRWKSVGIAFFDNDKKCSKHHQLHNKVPILIRQKKEKWISKKVISISKIRDLVNVANTEVLILEGYNWNNRSVICYLERLSRLDSFFHNNITNNTLLLLLTLI